MSTHNFGEIMQKDGLPLAIGTGTIFGSSLADLSHFSQQIGVILGAVLVFVTLCHRIFIFWKDTQK